MRMDEVVTTSRLGGPVTRGCHRALNQTVSIDVRLGYGWDSALTRPPDYNIGRARSIWGMLIRPILMLIPLGVYSPRGSSKPRSSLISKSRSEGAINQLSIALTRTPRGPCPY